MNAYIESVIEKCKKRDGNEKRIHSDRRRGPHVP